MPTTTTTLNTYRIAYGAPGMETSALRAHTIKAAYAQTDEQYTTFKDADNKTVYMIRNDHLVSIERVSTES